MGKAVPMNQSEPSVFEWHMDRLAMLPGWKTVGLGRAKYAKCGSVQTDTRQINSSGDLFVALEGERFDGHSFVGEAVAKGAAGVVVSENSGLRAPAGIVTFRVPDTTKALQQLANARRQLYAGKVVALTGSAGKSSTKNFVQQLAGSSVYVNPGNFNNQVGVPLSILRAPMHKKAWVLEMGMNAPGEIDLLTGVVQPDIGLLLPAGTAHVGHFSGPEEIIKAKVELVTSIHAPKKILVCGDQYDGYLLGRKLVRVGVGDGDYTCQKQNFSFPLGTQFLVSEAGWSKNIQTNLVGRHWQTAIAAAWAICRESELVGRRQYARLSKLCPPSSRMQLNAYNGGWILDDSYNASPESFHVFLDAVEELPSKLTLRVVVGDMFELGRKSRSIHDQIAKRLQTLKCAKIIAFGKAMPKALARQQVKFTNTDDAASAVRLALSRWRPGVMVATKAANGTGLNARLSEMLSDRERH